VSRFDGREFRNFGVGHGLPSAYVGRMEETTDGDLWFGTTGGLAHLRPEPKQGELPIEAIRLASTNTGNYIFGLLADPTGGLWIGTGEALWHGTACGPRWCFARVSLDARITKTWVAPRLLENDGSLWLATARGLFRRRPDGRTRFYPLAAREIDMDLTLEPDRAGRLWIFTSEGILVLRPDETSGEPAQPLLETARVGPDLGQQDDVAVSLPERPGEAVSLGATYPLPTFTVGRDGAVWIGTSRGLSRLEGGRLEPFARGALPAGGWTPQLEDRAGNLWATSEGHGVARIRRGGFVTYNRDDGLFDDVVQSVFEDSAGDILAITGGAPRHVSLFDGTRFVDVTPPSFLRLVPTARSAQIATQSADGDWWFSTREGLLRLAACPARDLATTPVRAVYGPANGLHDSRILHLFRARDGAVWVSTGQDGGGAAVRVDPASGKVEQPDGFAELAGIQSFAEDGAGHFYGSLLRAQGILRWQGATRRRLTVDDGLPAGPTSGVFLDSRGRLWVGGGGGVTVVETPAADHPRMRRYTTADGLTSDYVSCITEDREGRIYLGSESGVDRIDIATGRVESFTDAEGFLGGRASSCLRDRQGRLWFGTRNGLTRVDPEREVDPPATPALLEAVRVAGVGQPMPTMGTPDAGPLVFRPDPGSVEIDFESVSPESRNAPRYEYELQPVDRKWVPTGERSVLYGRLAAGSYRFLVRTAGARGPSARPASLAFVIQAPIWQRAWFVTLALALLILLVAASAALFHQARVRRLVALERVRTRIAADLHDDLGSSLSRISFLSELGSRRLGDGSEQAAEILADIGRSARELVEGTSDIVWAIDPRRDDLTSVLTRIRRFASDLLEAQGLAFSFETPAVVPAVPLAPERRRDLYLILKEAIHNVAKHAGARRAGVRCAVEAGVLVLEVWDDGVGLAGARESSSGRGLGNMRERAERLGATLRIGTAGETAGETSGETGTRLTLTVPLRGAVA
jgi:signal transduction histidine kinase/ligand-binding sensor domain-containing protein